MPDCPMPRAFLTVLCLVLFWLSCSVQTVMVPVHVKLDKTHYRVTREDTLKMIPVKKVYYREIR